MQALNSKRPAARFLIVALGLVITVLATAQPGWDWTPPPPNPAAREQSQPRTAPPDRAGGQTVGFLFAATERPLVEFFRIEALEAGRAGGDAVKVTLPPETVAEFGDQVEWFLQNDLPDQLIVVGPIGPNEWGELEKTDMKGDSVIVLGSPGANLPNEWQACSLDARALLAPQGPDELDRPLILGRETQRAFLELVAHQREWPFLIIPDDARPHEIADLLAVRDPDEVGDVLLMEPDATLAEAASQVPGIRAVGIGGDPRFRAAWIEGSIDSWVTWDVGALIQEALGDGPVEEEGAMDSPRLRVLVRR